MTNLNYLYNPDAVKDKFDKNHFVDKKLSFSVIERGTVLPHKWTAPPGQWSFGAGGIVDSQGEFINNSFIHYGKGGVYTPSPQDIQYRPETVIYLGLFYPVWGHELTDNIRHVWFLKSETFRTEFKNCPLVYIPWLGSTIEQYQSSRRLRELLGVDVGRLQPITRPTLFDRIILPDESFYSEADNIQKFTAEHRELLESLRHFAMKNRTPTSSKKLYFFYGRKQIGEERLAEYFKSKGYDIITHEQRANLDEELNLLINAESFASTLGSCAHNSVFLRDNIEVIFIPRSAKALSPYQLTLDQFHPSNATYIDSSFSVFNVAYSLYCFVISEQLKKFFGDKFNGYTDADFKIFLHYFKFAVDNGRDFNPEEVQGYGVALDDFLAQLKNHEYLIAACFRRRN